MVRIATFLVLLTTCVGCSRSVSPPLDPIAPAPAAAAPVRAPDAVQTVIGEGTRALLRLGTTEIPEGTRIRLRRGDLVTGTALVMSNDGHQTLARVLTQTEAGRPIAPGDRPEIAVAPITPTTPGPTSAPIVQPVQARSPTDAAARLDAERAYFELAAKVLRLPSDHAPELRQLQESLRQDLTPSLLPKVR